MRLGVLTGSVRPTGYNYEGEPEPNDYGMPSSITAHLGLGPGEVLLISRHGVPPDIPPHMINHAANIEALRVEGATHIISICSSGALSSEIKVPSLMAPDDYIDFFSGDTIVDSRIEHVTPGFNEYMRELLIRSARGSPIPFLEEGIYVQTRGPRLETRAEVRFLRSIGDVVGMNLGSEATIAKEMGIPFAGLVTIDNYANGVNEEELDFRNILRSAEDKWDLASSILQRILANSKVLD
ncbi:MAG: MTAP family purine nucleoside phosphorylase [Thermoplasmatota archaeon]